MEKTAFLGELLGTLTLLLLGNGVVANVVLNKTKGQHGGWMVITTGWAFAVAMGVFVANAFGSPDAHLNPAVTLAAAVGTGDWSKLPVYVPAQLLGAFLGAAIVWLHYLPHWAQTEDPAAKLACFSTAPAIDYAPGNFVSEVIATVVLLLGLKGIQGAGALPAGSGPFLVGILVWAVGLSLGGPTGYAINPARDLGPRIAHALLPVAGKGPSGWRYAWIPLAAPLCGALLAGWLFFGK